MRDALNLRHLTFFRALAETSSFTAAANFCGVSQPGLSAAIKELEADLGARLFDRDTRNVKLTDAGRALLPLVEITLANTALAARDLREQVSSGRTNVRVAAVSSVASYLLPAALALYGESSDVKIEVEDVSDIGPFVFDGRADIGVGHGPFDPETLEADFLFAVKLCAVASPAHWAAHQSELTWSEIALQKVVSYKPDTPVYRTIEATMAAQGLRFIPHGTYRYRQSLIGAVLAGTAIGILPALSLGKTLPAGLVEIPITDPVVSHYYFIVSRKGRAMSDEARKLRGFLRDQITQAMGS
jgi:LysR family transcriptional regulator, carnitine catabolism transcriptional activator